MGLETATYVSTLNSANPTTSDPLAQGDDHIRMLKAVLLATFPTLNAALSASLVPSSATGNLAATNVQAALAELQTDIDTRLTSATANAAYAPIAAKYIVQTADGSLTGAQALGALGTGLVKNTTTTGVLAIAAAGTDYVSPGLATTRGITMNTAKILGRTTASTGAIEEITVGTGLTLSAGTLTATATGGVTSVNGNTGAVTAAQISAAATTGYGYTPANGASYIPKDFAAGSYPIGCMVGCGVLYAGGVLPVGSTTTGSSLTLSGGSGTLQVGTWRHCGYTNLTDAMYIPTVMQRIA